MSTTLTENTSLVPATSLSGSSGIKPIKLASQAPISPWIWLAVTCAILSVSGGIRYWRDQQFRNLAIEHANCPFKLDEFPTELGTWHAEEGMDAQLDPETAESPGRSST